MFRGGHVAEEVRSGGRGDGTADGGRNVVVSRRYVGDYRAQDVERSPVAQ